VNFGPEGAPVMVRIPPDPSLPAEQRNWQAGWPRQDYLELAAVTEAVPSARYHARLILREWGAGELACDVEQVVAELVANAVTATRAVSWAPRQPPVRTWLLAREALVMAVVWDATTAVPVPRQPTAEDEHGRGLLLVGSLARWDYYPAPPDYGGKVVRALLPKGAVSLTMKGMTVAV
jgi:hypothetical protein